MQKVCDNCQKVFATNRINQRFCSADCRTKWYNHNIPSRSYAAYMERKKQAAIRRRGYSWEDLKKEKELKKTEKAKAEQARKEQIIDTLLLELDIFQKGE